MLECSFLVLLFNTERNNSIHIQTFTTRVVIFIYSVLLTSAVINQVKHSGKNSIFN